ncbi:hypothetical protein Ahy_B06g081778 [Arachis hypogaea]|uniref:SWIM-type domain-containing protein n=1 Tax=Arachis hypogaea TaxID=3818 RepID=A0A444YM03_ARAHY|nr:hypothetical protein Ahy_B06g081778 [Arachis hypogaea]
MAAIEKNREGIPKMRVTHCDRRASVFVVEELELLEDWLQHSFRVQLAVGTCECGLFQTLHYPCRHVLAGCAAASIKWAPYVHPEAVQGVRNGVSSDTGRVPMAGVVWTRLRLNPLMRRKAIGRPVFTRFQNDIDEVERQEKQCGLCRQAGHTRRACPNQPTDEA